MAANKLTAFIENWVQGRAHELPGKPNLCLSIKRASGHAVVLAHRFGKSGPKHKAVVEFTSPRMTHKEAIRLCGPMRTTEDGRKVHVFYCGENLTHAKRYRLLNGKQPSVGFFGQPTGQPSAFQVYTLESLLDDIKPCVVRHDGQSDSGDVCQRAAKRLSPGCNFIVNFTPNTAKPCPAKPLSKRLRGRAIVDSSDVLFFFPCENVEPAGRAGGLWSALRYCRQTNKPHYLVWPNGGYCWSNFAS